MRSLARLVAVVWLWASALAAVAAPPAQGGRIDLAGWEPRRDGVLVPEGEWSFAPGRLVGGDEPWPADAGFSKVPGAWQLGTWPGHGGGTYRLLIACDRPPSASMLLPGVQTAARVFLNGREIGVQGRPGLSPQEHRSGVPMPTLLPERFSCPSDLRIQVSNFEAPRGGLVRGIVLGEHAQLDRLRRQASASGGALVATGYVLGIFSLMLYLGRRREPVGLQFAIFCFALATANGLVPWRERVLQPLLDGVDTQDQLRILVAAYAVVTAMYPLMLRQLYPRQAPRRAASVISVASLVTAALYAAVPATSIAMVVVTAWAESVAALAYCCWTLVAALVRREAGAGILLASVLMLVVSTLTEGVLGSRSPGWGGVDIAQLGIVMAPAWLMARRFARALDAEELRAAEQGERADLLVRATKAGVLDHDVAGGVVRASDRYREMLGLSATASASTLPELASLVHPDDADRVAASLALPRTGDAPPGVRRHEAVEFRMRVPGGDTIWVHSEAITVHGESGEVLRHIRTFSDISHLKATERELAETQSRLVEEARRAGMAQVATNVLHNVGNVLTSVAVSSHLAAERVRHSRIARVADVAQLLETLGAGDGPGGDKARMLPGYVRELAQALHAERDELLADLARLGTSVDHVQNVVAMQQSYAGASRVLQPARATDLVDDALRLQEETLRRRGIEVRRDYGRVHETPLDRTRVVQVLVNLIENAAHAMEGVEPGRRTLGVEVRQDPGVTTLTVADTGCGIRHEDLGRIFSHGFTTKAQGHGFGLHACALAAHEMGGELTVRSDGPGAGATFTLRIPDAAPEPAAAQEHEKTA